MTVLGFDTSRPSTTACVIRPGADPVATPPPGPERLRGRPDHSAELLPLLARLLGEAGAGWDDVKAIAVGVGPGTFTGLRIGVATARALAQGLGVPLHPASSLEALAAGMAEVTAAGRPLLPLIDAKRGEVFTAAYEAGDPLVRVWGPTALAPADLVMRARGLEKTPLAAGDWSLESRTYLEKAGIEVPSPESDLHAVSAVQICRLGIAAGPAPPEEVNPVYLRVPDAEISRNARTEGPAGDVRT